MNKDNIQVIEADNGDRTPASVTTRADEAILSNENDNVLEFMKITGEMNKIYEAKNKDYGSSFDKSIDKFGLIASAIRMNDKLNRFETLIANKAQVKDESIEDTLIDLANYSIMTILHLKKNEG